MAISLCRRAWHVVRAACRRVWHARTCIAPISLNLCCRRRPPSSLPLALCLPFQLSLTTHTAHHALRTAHRGPKSLGSPRSSGCYSWTGKRHGRSSHALPCGICALLTHTATTLHLRRRSMRPRMPMMSTPTPPTTMPMLRRTYTPPTRETPASLVKTAGAALSVGRAYSGLATSCLFRLGARMP